MDQMDTFLLNVVMNEMKINFKEFGSRVHNGFATNVTTTRLSE